MILCHSTRICVCCLWAGSQASERNLTQSSQSGGEMHRPAVKYLNTVKCIKHKKFLLSKHTRGEFSNWRRGGGRKAQRRGHSGKVTSGSPSCQRLASQRTLSSSAGSLGRVSSHLELCGKGQNDQGRQPLAYEPDTTQLQHRTAVPNLLKSTAHVAHPRNRKHCPL